MTQATLIDPGVGTLELTCESGYIVRSVDVGAPVYREVSRNRALNDGADDDTQFLGPRAVTLTVGLDQRVADPQVLLDRIMLYQSPRRRPTLAWSLPGSTQVRALANMSPRGAPLEFSGPKYQTLGFQWVAPDGRAVSVDEHEVLLNPSSDIESGRTYPELYTDGGRGPYPFSAGVGSRSVRNDGNELADWRLVIYGPAVNPEFRINGISVDMNVNGGLNLLAGESLWIDTRERTILLNNDPTISRYDRSNFTQWSWGSLRLQPGDNLVRIAADSGQVSARFYWRSTYLT
jgi:hypothetical protein